LVKVALGGCPFEDHMRLESWKSPHKTKTLMIRGFIATYVEAAYWLNVSGWIRI
jgi:hypothetical protein